jgi:mannosyltransferase OCH1-like enzyme
MTTRSGGEPVIPLHIYQTWKTKHLPEGMQKCVDKLKEGNPEFEHHLYSDEECRTFIADHFEPDVVYAYDKLIPGAYRADLWRYCVLYINGGIYLDIKYYNVPPFKLIELTDKEYFAKDIEQSGSGIYQAVMVCKPGNPKLKGAIDAIARHAKEKYYGNSIFDVTGPTLLRRFFTDEEWEKCEITLGEGNGCLDKTCIYKDGRAIMSIYRDYREEQDKTSQPKYYDLWAERKIWKEEKKTVNYGIKQKRKYGRQMVIFELLFK